MGGQGSGSWYRWDKQTTMEEVKRIDIRYLQKHGWLCDSPDIHKVGKLSWTSNREKDGFINCMAYHDRFVLDYRFRRGRGEWEPVTQTVYLDSTPCNYGGVRKWFLCPRCDRRVGILCGYDKLFLCRHCYQLPYRSQNEGYMDRLISKKHKLGERIFEDYDGDGWRKKKGMHQSTFDRLYREYIWLNRKVDRFLQIKLNMMM